MSTDLTRRLLENVPAPMQSATRWCNWRYEVRNGKRTKVPVCSATGGPASTTDPRTWGTLAAALAAPKWMGSFAVDGVGYVFAAQDRLVGVDLDGCRDPDTGELTPFAVDVMSRLQTYTEVTPSQGGLHIICRGTWPGPRHRTKGIEVYSAGRFFTMTGHILTPYGLELREAELAALYRDLFPEPPPDTGPPLPPSAPPPLDDGSILRIARRAANGPKFARLWSGDWSDYPGEKQSAADLALCRILSFYSGDFHQIERLMSASGLGQREKWRNRADYRDRTIRLVLAQPGPRFGVGRAA